MNIIIKVAIQYTECKEAEEPFTPQYVQTAIIMSGATMGIDSMDSTDVDSTSRPLPSANRAKLDIREDQLYSINQVMNEDTESYAMPPPNTAGEGMILPKVLRSLLWELSATKAKFIPPMGLARVKGFIQDLNDIERGQLIDGMRKGLDSKDWSDMIAHR